MTTLTINHIDETSGAVSPRILKNFMMAVAGIEGQVEIYYFDDKKNIVVNISMKPEDALMIASKLAEAAGFAQAKADLKAGKVSQAPGSIH
jgi:hypothetical protein